MGDLPTMVPPTSIFSSSGSSADLRSSDDDDDDEDDDDNEDNETTPSPTSPLAEQQPNFSQTVASLLQSVMANGSGNSSKQSKQQSSQIPPTVGLPLFPFASFIPATSTSQTPQPTFGFLPGSTNSC